MKCYFFVNSSTSYSFRKYTSATCSTVRPSRLTFKEINLWPVFLKIFPKYAERFLREDRYAVFLALATSYKHTHLLAVNYQEPLSSLDHWKMALWLPWRREQSVEILQLGLANLNQIAQNSSSDPLYHKQYALSSLHQFHRQFSRQRSAHLLSSCQPARPHFWLTIGFVR